MSAHVNMCVSMSAQGCPAGALAVGLVYVATRLKVRGEGGGAWSALGPLKSPTPFSHLTNGWWGGVNSKSESVSHHPHPRNVQYLLLEAIFVIPCMKLVN